ncbi:MAG: hypothetical protein IJY99_00035 [Alphaproteobacteria bacterium]|nr:hypothetical protein [Alphaproteobacteria bacterium]
MMKLRKILSKIFVAIFAIMLVAPVFGASSNIPGAPDIGDHGQWLTENNRSMFIGNMTNDVDKFQGSFQQQLVENYVPIEAKIGLAFINGMSLIADVLNSSLVRFMIMFIIIMYAFWIMLETYKMMTTDSNLKKLATDIVKKGTVISIWLIILNFGPAQVFMWVMGPIISIGTYLSDMILNAVAQSAGAKLPDTCAAIREYAVAHTSQNNIIDANAAADMLCLPTRLSGFCYTAIAAGWQWVKYGIGTSMFTTVAGGIFIVGFLIVAWKFAFMALGIIADLFLGVMMLPFTAVAETVSKTSYKGIVGSIFNGFLEMFQTESLSTQINRFVQTAVYFVSLSIVIAFCAALLSGVVDFDMAANIPTLESQDFLTTLLCVALTWWFADKSMKIAQDLGGKIEYGVGTQMRNDTVKLWNLTKTQYRSWRNAIKEERAKKEK